MGSGVLLDRKTGRPVVDRGVSEALEARGLRRVEEMLERSALRPDLVGLESNPPLYMDVSSAYSGDELGLPWRDVLSEGVVIVSGSAMPVSAQAGANSVNVGPGACWVLGDTNPARQPLYRCYNDAIVNLGINPDPANPRQIRVVAQVTDQSFAGSGRLWALTAIHGTPAASPAIPAEPASALSLATILVPAAAATSAAYTFTDVRPNAAVGGGQAVGLPQAWTAFTPAWGSSGTAPAIGNGTLLGRYAQIGKAVHFVIYMAAGSTTTYGTGTYTLSAPVGISPNLTAGAIGHVEIFDSSAGATYMHAARIAGLTNFTFMSMAAPGVAVTNVAPVTFANGDLIIVHGTYEAA